ncbi:MAG: GTPase [archaeon]
MNFQNLQNIETADKYLDMAFAKASKKSAELRKNFTGDRLKKSKDIETEKLDIINNVLCDQLTKILDSFPSINQLDDFYQELIKITLDYVYLKKSLGSIKWAVDRTDNLFRIYRGKIANTADIKKINSYRQEFYGRVSSVMKQIKKFLEYVEHARKVMKDYPSIKTSMPSVCIFGFPNAGKSTLLKKLTGANPEIKAYHFTTKQLNLGYIDLKTRKIQVIDTPGTLNRQKMNLIEMQAYLAVKHLASMIVYVFDPSLEIPLKDQEKLLKNLKSEFKTEIVLYLSKTDVADADIIKEIKEKHPTIMSLDDLKEYIIKNTVIKKSETNKLEN